MGDLLDALLASGSLRAALWAGLLGTALLLAVGLARRLKAGRRTAAPGRTGPAETQAAPGAAPGPLAAAPRQRAEAAYAAHAAAIPRSSAAAGLPITSSAPPAGPQCPPALSQRIDRLEAKVRARRAASHG